MNLTTTSLFDGSKKNFVVLDLFSGIGGFSLGLEAAGAFRTVAFCERDKFCQAVLRKHWPDTPIHDDVRAIDTDGLGDIDLICGGFPCQPWSVAGEQRGAEDDRDLWPVMASLIEKLRPQWVIGENVRGFVNEPLGLQRSLSDLESIGYQAVPFIIPACAVDAPHRRDRVWIVAHANDQRECSGSGKVQGTNGKIQQRDHDAEFGNTSEQKDVADTGRHATRPSEDVADANRSGQCEQRGSEPVQEEQSASECTGSRNRPEDHWISEPAVGRLVNGVSRRVDRLKALGNAVVPQVVTQIGKAIIEAEGA